MSTPLWEMQTMWFTRTTTEFTDNTFHYKSWKDFVECKPYKLWKPYILSSWSWKTIFSKDYQATRRYDVDKTVMDCSPMLRTTTSSYDKPSPFADSSEAKGLEMLQIVFLSPDRFTGVHRVEIVIQRDDEENVKEWLTKHMPSFWKLE
jgi:hypothetical protein